MSDQPHDPNPAHTAFPDTFPPLHNEQPEVTPPHKHRSIDHRMHDAEHHIAEMMRHMEGTLGFKIPPPPAHHEEEEDE